MATTGRGLAAFDPRVGARYATLIVGAWFFMSALIWHHGAVVGSLDWILGLGVIVLTLFVLRQPRLHWGIAAFGAWLLVQSAVLPHVRESTVWNERVVGVLLVLLGLVGGGQLPAQDT
jgi:hypothetical protein